MRRPADKAREGGIPRVFRPKRNEERSEAEWFRRDASPAERRLGFTTGCYGFGWFQQDYDGHAVDFHTGSIDGMVAIAGLIREEGIGVYVLGNRDHVEVRHALMLRAFDALLGSASRDWSAELLALYNGLAEAQQNALEGLRAARAEGTRPHLDPAGYAGTYRHEVGGEIVVRQGDDGLRLDYGPGLEGPLTHWSHETFRVAWDARWRGEALVTFQLDLAGKPMALSLGETRFRRVADAP